MDISEKEKSLLKDFEREMQILMITHNSKGLGAALICQAMIFHSVIKCLQSANTPLQGAADVLEFANAGILAYEELEQQ